MPTNLLPVPHHKQSHSGACLPACAHMILRFYGQPVSETELSHHLGTRWYGTPAPNLRRLESLGFSVVYESITLTALQANLENELPAILFVRTDDLPYWNEPSAHAFVVIGIDEEFIYVNDPAFDNAPQSIPLDYFLLAWSEFDHRCGIIRPQR